jgi:hypothetical protein
MSKFEREERYIVIKISDLQGADNICQDSIDNLIDLEKSITVYRNEAGKQPLKCAVIEHDWPEYEPVLEMIKKRVIAENHKTETPKFVLIAKDEDGNDVVPKVGDQFIRLNGGNKSMPFNGEITKIYSDKISVIGGGYIGGCHYGKWWGDLLLLDHLTILKTNTEK